MASSDSPNDNFDRIRLVFRRTNNLPQLRGTALKLVQAIDHTDASASQLEGIITTDPGLTTMLLRVANSALIGYDGPVTSVRGAIMRLGHRSIRSLAVSLTVHDVLLNCRRSRTLDLERFARHSLFVGLLARYIYIRKQKLEPFETEWSADEILSAGVLHDLASPLLATFAPEVFDRAYLFAERRRCPVPIAFSTIFGLSMGELAADACEAWSLPAMFPKALRYVDNPWEFDNEFISGSCLNFANHIAVISGYGTEPWPMESTLAPEVTDEHQLGPEELDYVVAGIDRHVSELITLTSAAA